MRGNRDIAQGEVMPNFENIVLEINKKHQIRYDFEQVEKDGKTSFNYHYVNVANNNRDEIISAIIRDRYSIDDVESIVNNYLDSKDIIEYLKLQNFRKYAKAVADQDQEALSGVKQAQTYRISLPFNETLQGGAYADLADRMLKVKVIYESDPVANVAIVYPKWVAADDMALLEADQNVTIEQISLHA